MRTYLILWVVLFAFTTSAQSSTLQLGDPPDINFISISAPDGNGIVTITGARNAVFPTADVTIRNLYTGEAVYVTAGITGSFVAEIYGPGNTPFWISPAEDLPANLRGLPGSLPGGPGTIIYGDFDNVIPTEPTETTQIIIDGVLDDWPGSGEVRALTNSDSFYLAVEQPLPDGARLGLTVDSLELIYDPAQPGQVLLGANEINTATRYAEDVLELRLPLAEAAALRNANTITRLYILSEDDVLLEEQAIDVNITQTDARNGFVYPGGPLRDPAQTFNIAGETWTADGRINTLDAVPGENVTLELDVTLDAPEATPDALIGELVWQLVDVPGLYTNNGWSNVTTPLGLGIANLSGDVNIASVTLPDLQIVPRDESLLAALRFDITVPDDLPPGHYVPAFRGYIQRKDAPQPFDDGPVLTRTPLVLTTPEVERTRLLWTLFHDDPADGVRGLIAEEDAVARSLNGRVKFQPTRYVLPPGTYPVEPYLLNLMPNQYEVVTAPLLPLAPQTGEIEVTITRPNGSTDTLDAAPIIQNQLSTAATDERDRFGGQAPLDVYRLTTLQDTYRNYPFDLYGEYEIQLTGAVEDIYGNEYVGGGTYVVTIAEQMELLAGMLPGAPVVAGEPFYLGGRVLPEFPAQVTANVQIAPNDGDVITLEPITMQADRYGAFAPPEPLVFDMPGEYVIDYEARYTLPDGQLWLTVLRSAGVITDPDSSLVAHGQRGLVDFSGDYRPAWYTVSRYGEEADPFMYAPYFSGDVVVMGADAVSRVYPVLHAQDTQSAYQNWLTGTLPNYQSPDGLPLADLAALQELPLRPVLGGPRTIYGTAIRPEFIANQAYAYISAVRPGVALRQFVSGGDAPTLPAYWDGDDRYNGQIGAGIEGDAPGDYAFLFGGLVVRNAEAALSTTAGYAALVVVGDEDAQPRVYPPFRPAPDGSSLIDTAGETVDAFFVPTGLRPGQVIPVGETVHIAGHSAPALNTAVNVTVTAPSGEVREFEGVSNSFGYYYEPANNFTVNENGVWTVRLNTRSLGPSSDGIVEPPSFMGNILGVEDTFQFYAITQGTPGLAWSPGDGDGVLPFRPASRYNFTLNIPPEWTNIDATYHIGTPTYPTLESGETRIGGSTVSFQYDPVALARTYPNLELEGEGPAASDLRTITFVITGRDPLGEQVIASRSFALFHDRLLTFEDVPRE